MNYMLHTEYVKICIIHIEYLIQAMLFNYDTNQQLIVGS